MSQAAVRDAPQPIPIALCLSPDAISRFGVIARHLIVGLIDQPFRLLVLSSDAKATSLSLGPVQVIPHTKIGRLFSRRRFQRLIESLSPQLPAVIHAMSRESYDLAARLVEALDAELVLQVSSHLDSESVDDFASFPRTTIITTSQPLTDKFEPRQTSAPDGLQLIRPGVVAASTPAAFATPDRDPTAVCTADLMPDQGVDRLLQAAALLRNRGLPLLIFLLGTGRWEDELRVQANRLGLSSSVTFAPSATNLSQAFQGADIFVQPSAATQFSADSFLAMAQGMAVVACRNPISDHLHHGQTAWVCESSTPECLADGLESILRDRVLGQTLGAKALEYLRTHHLVSTMVEKTATLYRRLALAHATFPMTGPGT